MPAKPKKGWITRLDGNPDTLEKVRAQSLRGAIWVVFWTPGHYLILPTRKRAEEIEAKWKLLKERAGWKTWGFGGASYAHPTDRPGEAAERRVCFVGKYDPQTLKPLDDHRIDLEAL